MWRNDDSDHHHHHQHNAHSISENDNLELAPSLTPPSIPYRDYHNVNSRFSTPTTPEPSDLSSTRSVGYEAPLNPSTTYLGPVDDSSNHPQQRQYHPSEGFEHHHRQQQQLVAAHDQGDMYDYSVVPEKRSRSRYRVSRPQRIKKRTRRRCLCALIALTLLVIIFAAVFVPIYFKIVKPNSKKGQSAISSTSNPTGSNPGSPTGAISGGDGSTIITSSGESFVYTNKFGGTWCSDPNNPFSNNAQAQADTPPLNTSWTWGKDWIRGVNLGGWFVIEPFITPAFFQKYPSAVDEWTLSEAMRADTASGGINQLEDHYNTFITEKDFAEIAGAGLNWIRLPIPFWAIETWPGEPFLEKTAWKYILQALQWARKYGIRVNLDLHTAPGSQNGYNHSGKSGQINFLSGVMGIANAQRLLGYIRVITEFISQPEWKDVVPLFGIINEARVAVIGKDEITSFYLEAHDMIRGITGLGEGNGPVITIHDGFVGLSNWTGFLQGSDRIAMDTHPYFAFDGQANNEPLPAQPAKACGAWANDFNSSQRNFGVTVAGEFSNGINDCGLFLLGPQNPQTSYESHGGNCSDWTIWENWTQATKDGLRDNALASMDALNGNWFWWTWKIANDTVSGSVRSPLWSYQLGLEQGWMPTDPKDSVGKCQSAGVTNLTPFSTYSSWQTGGAGAGTIAPSSVSAFGQWPPTTIRNLTPDGAPVSLLPTYTSTGPVPTLPPPTLTAVVNGATKTIDAGNGWADASDTGGAATTISGCSYPDPWNAANVAVPTAACPVTTAKRSLITPAPKL